MLTVQDVVGHTVEGMEIHRIHDQTPTHRSVINSARKAEERGKPFLASGSGESRSPRTRDPFLRLESGDTRRMSG